MKHNVLAPSVGESITEVSILKWAKENGQAVKSGDLLLEIESDKATVEIVAEQAGVLTILKPAGEMIPIGALIGTIDTEGKATVEASAPAPSPSAGVSSSPKAPSAASPASTPSSGASTASAGPTPGTGPHPGPGDRKAAADGRPTASSQSMSTGGSAPTATASTAPARSAPTAPAYVARPGDRRVPMSMLRARIAERLVQAQHTAAILTTFNECDMSAVNALRKEHKVAFKAKHGVNLSYMSFFTRACVEALKLIPEVNASIDGRDTIYHDYYEIGIAVGSDRGLVVPVVRDAEKLGFVEIEKKIGELAVKARDGKLGIADMSGGTFTISNGGTYGSMMSTPILNPPQSGILGMHKIQDRPMAVNGKVEIRPMMYLALSYDHRLVDGKGAVTFLVHVKDFIENPDKLGLTY